MKAEKREVFISDDGKVFDTVDLAAHRELHGNAVLGQLLKEAGRHPSLLVDAWQFLKKHRSAGPASVTLALDAEVGFLPLHRVVTEVNDPRPMLHNIGISASAFLNDWVEKDGVDVQLAVDLLIGDRVVVIHPKKAEPNSVFHARFPAKSREHEPVNSTCQIRELAA